MYEDAGLSGLHENLLPPRRMVQSLAVAASSKNGFTSRIPALDVFGTRMRPHFVPDKSVNHRSSTTDSAVISCINAWALALHVAKGCNRVSMLNYVHIVTRIAIEDGPWTAKCYHQKLQASLERKCQGDDFTTGKVNEFLSVIDRETLKEAQRAADNGASSNTEPLRSTQRYQAPQASAQETPARGGKGKGGGQDQGNKWGAWKEKPEAQQSNRWENKKPYSADSGSSKAACFDFQKGSCSRGADCRFAHICSECGEKGKMRDHSGCVFVAGTHNGWRKEGWAAKSK